MPRGTFVIELDLAEDDSWSTDVTDDIIDATTFCGRGDELDAAREGRLTLTLNNSTGKYSPKNPGGISLVTLAPIRVRTTAPEIVNQFRGFITEITVDPNPKKQQVEISASDSMVVLRAVIVSQRLMEDQPTGVIIHRLLDAAEGELLDNPVFDEEPWIGAGCTPTRESDAPVLEGPVSMEVPVTGAGQGAYTPALSSSGSETLVGVAYLQAASAEAVGKEVAVRLSEGAGVKAAGTAALSDAWQRVVTSDGALGSGVAVVLIVTSVTAGTYAWRTGAAHCVESKVAIPRSLDGGRTNLSYYGPLRREAMSAIDEVRDNELGGLFYFNRGGTAVYEERTHRFASTIDLGTIDEDFWRLDYKEKSGDRFSKVSLNYAQFDLGAPATYGWNLELPESRPVSMGGTEVIWADYGFISKDSTKPVANTDYRINSKAAGDGNDMAGSGTTTLTWTPYGEGARFQIVNHSTIDTAWITQLAVRSTPIRQSSDKKVAEYEPDSVPSVRSELEHDYDWNDHQGSVKSWAEHLGKHYSTQREDLSITLRPRNAVILSQMLLRDVSDRVKLINEDKAHATYINGSYFIESVRHKIRKGGFLSETTWKVTPVFDHYYWVLGTGKLGHARNLITTTRPAP